MLGARARSRLLAHSALFVWARVRARARGFSRHPGTMVELSFSSGTLEIRGLAQADQGLCRALNWDARSACFRAEAGAYAELVRALVSAKIPYHDAARCYAQLAAGALVQRE